MVSCLRPLALTLVHHSDLLKAALSRFYILLQLLYYAACSSVFNRFAVRIPAEAFCHCFQFSDHLFFCLYRVFRSSFVVLVPSFPGSPRVDVADAPRHGSNRGIRHTCGRRHSQGRCSSVRYQQRRDHIAAVGRCRDAAQAAPWETENTQHDSVHMR